MGGACILGNIGPGGGLVFLISGGLRYEMAPKTWGASETGDGIRWCSDWDSVVTGDAIGTGRANTTSMLTTAGLFAACTASAPNVARAYAGGGLTDWFLPSSGELEQMWLYSRVIGFNTATYGFAAGQNYWSSSEWDVQRDHARGRFLGIDGSTNATQKATTENVRPIRAF